MQKNTSRKKKLPKKPTKQALSTKKEVNNCFKTKEMSVNFKIEHQ